MDTQGTLLESSEARDVGYSEPDEVLQRVLGQRERHRGRSVFVRAGVVVAGGTVSVFAGLLSVVSPEFGLPLLLFGIRLLALEFDWAARVYARVARLARRGGGRLRKLLPRSKRGSLGGEVSEAGVANTRGKAQAARSGAKENRSGFSWRTLGVILAVAAPASLLIIPYSMALLGQGDGPEVPLWTLVVVTLIQGLVFAGIAAGLGLWLGPKVGLGAPDLRGVLHGEPGSGRRVLSALPLAAGLGVGCAVALLALQAALAPLLPDAVQRSFEAANSTPSPWEGFLASISAGINEEVWFRLGLMSLFVFVGAKLLGQGERPASGVVWTAMVLVALLFGAIHLPQAAAIGGSLPASVVAFVLLGNGLAAVVFGWLYWKRGLIAAMVAHFSANVVLKVIVVAAMPVLS